MFWRKYWIGLTVFLVAIIGISLYYLQTRPPKDPIVIYKPVEPLPKSTAEVSEGDTAQGGHFHADGTWHEGPRDSGPTAKGPRPTPPSQSSLDVSLGKVLTKEEEAERRKYWAEMELDPPPPGHGYQWDEHGNATLYQYNVPEFKVKWSETEIPGQDYFKLTDEEWRRFRALQVIISQNPLRLTQEHEKILRAGGPFPTVTYAPGVVELAKEKLVELDQKASGPTASVSTDITWNRPATPEDIAGIRSREFEMLQSLENEKPKRPPAVGWDGTFFQSLVKELEAEVQRREPTPNRTASGAPVPHL